MASPHKTRILVSSHDLRFFKPILNAWTANPAYEALIEEHRFHEITEPRKCQEMLEQADVVFCEWCLGNAVWYSQHKKPAQKLIVRLHSQELRLPFVDQVNWSQVDRVILICPLHQKLLIERYPALETKCLLIYNPIDARTLDQPKLFGAEFNLGLLGMCPRLKGPHLAVELLTKLKSVDLRYTLFIKGKRPEDYAWLMQRAEERDYYQEFYQSIEASKYRNSVVFEGYDSNVAGWFRKIGFILSTSEREGSHQSVAEGMAAGSLPILRNWPGAELLYPGRFVFGNLDEAVALILGLKTAGEYSHQCRSVKQHAQTNFEQTVVVSQYDKLLADLDGDSTTSAISLRREAAPDPQAPPPNMTLSSSKQSLVALHVCFLTPGRQNGYAIRVMEETQTLTKQGVEVVIACFIPETPPGPLEEIQAFKQQLETATGTKCYLLPTKNFFNIPLGTTEKDAITEVLVPLAKAHQVDIIHGQALYSTMHALRLRQKVDAKVVFDVHGITPEEMEMSGANPLRISTTTEWERSALGAADLRVFVSSGMRAHFQRKYGLRSRVDCVVPCGVHAERFSMTEDERLRKRKEMGLSEKFVFLYLGTLSVWQWPEALFSVFAQFHQREPGSLLLLLLPENDHQLALSYCRKHGLAPGSYLLKEVPHHDVGLVAGVADIGLLLRKEHPVNAVSSPTKFGEYLAAGVPVVATENIGDTSELIGAEQVGLVVSPTDQGLNNEELEKLVRFAEDVKAHRSEWSRRASLAASRQLGWTARVRTLIDQYRILARAPSQEAEVPQRSTAHA